MTTAMPDIQHHEIDRNGRRIVIFALPHVDADSLLGLDDALRAERFDAIAVELDEQRRAWLDERDNPDKLNLLDILKDGQGARLGSYLALRILEKRMGSFDDTEPGDDMAIAVACATATNTKVYLLDRDMETTGLRAWRNASRKQRFRIVLSFLISPSWWPSFLRNKSRVPETLDDHLEQIQSSMPTISEAFLKERNRYLSHKINAIDADRIAVVLTPPHVEAVLQQLDGDADAGDSNGAEVDLSGLDAVPTKSLMSRLTPWLLSAFIALLFVSGFYFGDTETLRNMAVTWALINVGVTALFTAAALAHPVAVITAGLSSPIVSLNPGIGAGVVGAITQSLLVPPALVEIENFGKAITSLRGWWQNRLARIILIFVFANLGSTIATFIALALLPGMMGI